MYNNIEVEKMRKNKKIRIKQNKKNIFFVLVGRITTFLLIYISIIKIGLILLEYIVNNCITTL